MKKILLILSIFILSNCAQVDENKIKDNTYTDIDTFLEIKEEKITTQQINKENNNADKAIKIDNSESIKTVDSTINIDSIEEAKSSTGKEIVASEEIIPNEELDFSSIEKITIQE
jgi:hypothetical protein